MTGWVKRVLGFCIHKGCFKQWVQIVGGKNVQFHVCTKHKQDAIEAIRARLFLEHAVIDHAKVAEIKPVV